MTSLTALLSVGAAAIGQAQPSSHDIGLLGYGLAAGMAALGAGLGISKLAAASVESMARQPEASGDIRGAMILTAALIEGVCLFSCVVGLVGLFILK